MVRYQNLFWGKKKKKGERERLQIWNRKKDRKKVHKILIVTVTILISFIFRHLFSFSRYYDITLLSCQHQIMVLFCFATESNNGIGRQVNRYIQLVQSDFAEKSTIIQTWHTFI